uniref:Ribosome-inactivating protein n=1 Tax=Panax ginseng TaxID=4054 RepID=Q0PVD2_PANGI|nr:ribosome-inactivating protein [Panax ginseng]
MMQLAMSGTRMTGLVVVLLMLTGDHYATAGSSNYLLLPTQKDNVNANLPTVTLTTVGITRQIFNNFVDAVRDLVVSGPPVHGLLRLRDRSTVPISQRFILVELYNYEATPITLAIDVTNLYVVGYRTGDLFYYFLDSAVDTPGIFRELPHIELPFNSSYPALQHEAGDRVNIPLGITELDQSIQDLRHYRRTNLARPFIVVIQMVSEAVRFRYIENLVVLSIRADGSRQNFRPTRTMISLENNWDTLSTSIQQSVEGRFTPSVELVNREDQSVLVSSVTPGLILNIAVMIFVCNNPNPNQLISPMRHVNVDHVMGINDDHICSIIPEPTIRISGRNGLCADVKDRSFHDGNPIILFPCKSNEDENQLWTLKTDGTTRSNGKCMTAYGFKARQYVMIYNCATAVPTATKWQVWGNGTIINPESGLVLTAGLGSSRTELTVDNNI